MAGSAEQVARTVLFGQTQTLCHSMNEAFRRFEHIEKRVGRALRATGEHTPRAGFLREEAKEMSREAKRVSCGRYVHARAFL